MRLFNKITFVGSVAVESLDLILASRLLPIDKPTELDNLFPGAPNKERSKRVNSTSSTVVPSASTTSNVS